MLQASFSFRMLQESDIFASGTTLLLRDRVLRLRHCLLLHLFFLRSRQLTASRFSRRLLIALPTMIWPSRDPADPPYGAVREGAERPSSIPSQREGFPVL